MFFRSSFGKVYGGQGSKGARENHFVNSVPPQTPEEKQMKGKLRMKKREQRLRGKERENAQNRNYDLDEATASMKKNGANDVGCHEDDQQTFRRSMFI